MQPTTGRRLRRVLAAGTAALLLTAPAALASDISWLGSGQGATWSTATNWSGDAAPSGSVTALTLPPLSTGCSGWACAYGIDDIPTLTVGELQIDAASGYLVSPLTAADGISLTGGLTFSSPGTTAAGAPLSTAFTVPLTLAAPQSWNVAGVTGTATTLQLGAVTGVRSALHVNLAAGVKLASPELDTGPLSLAGAGTVELSNPGPVQPLTGTVVTPPPLLAPAGVSLTSGASLTLTGEGTISGPITIAPGSASTLTLGPGSAPAATLLSYGNVTLRASSALALWIDAPAAAVHAQPAAGSDYAQLRVLGNLSLNDATLTLVHGYTDTQVACAQLTPGQTYTLAIATKLIGTFAGIANGQAVGLGACDPLAPTPTALIIHYNTTTHPQTVTATVIGVPQIRTLVSAALTLPPRAATAPGLLHAGGYGAVYDAPAPGTLALTWTTRLHGRLVTVASASNTAAQVGPRRLAIRLTPAGRRLLRALARATHVPRPGRGRRARRAPARAITLTATATLTPNAQSPSTLTALTVRRAIRIS